MNYLKFFMSGILFVSLMGVSAYAQEMKTIKVGDLHPITGPASYYGIPESRAIQLAAQQINASGGLDIGGTKYKIQIVTADAKANPTAGVAALRKLLSDGVNYIIGPLSSGVAPALKPIIENNDDITQIVDGAITQNLTNGRNIFRNQATVGSYTKTLVNLIKQKSYETIAMMTDRFHAGFMGSEQELVSALEPDTEVVAQEYYQLGDAQFLAQLTSIIAEGPAALVIRGYPAEGARITKQARNLGYKGQIVWNMVAPPSTVAKNIPSAVMDGVYNAIPLTTEGYVRLGAENAVAMAKAYKQMFGAKPGELSALSYDALYILAAALDKAGTTNNEAVNKALSSLKLADVPQLINSYEPYEGGKLFSEQGQVLLPGVASVWKGDGWVPLPGLAAE